MAAVDPKQPLDTNAGRGVRLLLVRGERCLAHAISHG